MKKKQYVFLGLGVFGSTIVKTLSQFGHEVLAIDKDEECVQRIADYATRAIIGDITDQKFLADLGIEEFDVGIVAIGNHLEESLLGVLNLKELGVPYIVAKAKNKRFMTILEQIGADRIIRPEKEMGERVARSLIRKNITDLIEIDENHSVVEMKAATPWVGHKISELDLRKRYSINLLGIRNRDSHALELTIDPSYVVQNDDHFLLIAKTDIIERFDYLVESGYE